MKEKLGKKIYEVTIRLYDSGKVCTTQKGNAILVSRPVSNHLSLGILSAMVTHMKNKCYQNNDE